MGEIVAEKFNGQNQADKIWSYYSAAMKSKLSTMNNRTVYRGADGKVYSLDTERGEFELINSKTGTHEGVVNLFGLKIRANSLDKSGGHDLRVK